MHAHRSARSWGGGGGQCFGKNNVVSERLTTCGRGGSRGLAAAGSILSSTIAPPLQSIRLDGRKPANAACHAVTDAKVFQARHDPFERRRVPSMGLPYGRTQPRGAEPEVRASLAKLEGRVLDRKLPKQIPRILSGRGTDHQPDTRRAGTRARSNAKSQAALKTTARAGRLLSLACARPRQSGSGQPPSANAPHIGASAQKKIQQSGESDSPPTYYQ